MPGEHLGSVKQIPPRVIEEGCCYTNGSEFVVTVPSELMQNLAIRDSPLFVKVISLVNETQNWDFVPSGKGDPSKCHQHRRLVVDGSPLDISNLIYHPSVSCHHDSHVIAPSSIWSSPRSVLRRPSSPHVDDPCRPVRSGYPRLLRLPEQPALQLDLAEGQGRSVEEQVGAAPSLLHGGGVLTHIGDGGGG